MLRLTSKEFEHIADVPWGTFKAAVSRNEGALAFGTARPLAGGTLLDLDAVAWMLVDELTPAFSRPFGAALVREFGDKWLEGVARADRTDELVFLVVMESGAPLRGRMRARREGINVTAATLPEFATFDHRKARTIPERLTLINLTSLLARLRANAAEIGVELPKPMCPALNDPDFQAVRRETKRSREALIPRLPARQDT